MRRNYFCGWIGAVLTAIQLTASAQPKAPPPGGHHPLWRVDGGSNTIYLLGSVHLLKPSDYPLPPVIMAAFSNAQVVAFETDLSPEALAGAQEKLAAKTALPPGETIKDELSPATYSALTRYLSGAGLPVEMVENVRPAMAGMLLDVVEFQKLGLDPARGLDQYFQEQAQSAGKKIDALEPIDFQISLLTGFSKADGELFLKDTLSEMDETERNFDAIIAAWKAGDAAQLEKYLNDALKDAPILGKRLLTDRNKQWLPKIQALASSGKSAIIIVGAGHLVGKEGLIELLTRKGYTVTQL